MKIVLTFRYAHQVTLEDVTPVEAAGIIDVYMQPHPKQSISLEKQGVITCVDLNEVATMVIEK